MKQETPHIEFYVSNISGKVTLQRRLFSTYNIAYDNKMGFTTYDRGFRLLGLEFGRKVWVRP